MVRAAAEAYVQENRNTVTAAGLLEAVQQTVPSALLDASDDFFIKHAVPGATDDDPQYPLDIPGSDGAVAAVFEVDDQRIGFASSFPHETEELSAEEVAVAGVSEGLQYDESGNVIGYTGNADKLVFPEEFAGAIGSGTKSGFDGIRVVVIHNQMSLPHRAFASWPTLVAVQIADAQVPWALFENTKTAYSQFEGCAALKYVKLPESICTTSSSWNICLPQAVFKNCSALENVTIPALAGGAQTQYMGYEAFYGTAVYDVFLPEQYDYIASDRVFSAASASQEDGNITRFSDQMSFCRAVALAAAEAGGAEFSYADEAYTLNVIRSAITGAANAQTLRENLSYSWNGTWHTDERTASGTLSISDGVDTIPLAFSYTFSDAMLNLKVQASKEASFTLSIPAQPGIVTQAGVTAIGDIAVKDAALDPSGRVTVTAAGDFTFRNEEGAIPYILAQDEAGTPFEQFIAGNGSATQPLFINVEDSDWDAAPLGQYTDSITFSARYTPGSQQGGLEDANALKCYIANASGTTAITKETFLPSVAYLENGEIQDTMFDSFIFLPSPNYLYHWGSADGGMKALDKEDWQHYVSDVTFAQGVNVDALNEAVGDTKAALGNNEYQAKAFFALFYPVQSVAEFGEVDGKSLDLSKLEDRKAALKWMVDEYIRQFEAKNYQHVQIGGFYWYTENMRSADEQLPELIRYITDYIRFRGYRTIWSCYYQASGYADWYELGFDAAGYQPNFFPEHKSTLPNRGTETRLYQVAQAVQQYGLGVEIELCDGTQASAEVLKKYYEVGYETGYIKGFHTYYFNTGPALAADLCNSDNAVIRSAYEETHAFIKGTYVPQEMLA